MFLTHVDREGNSSPAILIENSTAANRAVNIPEFVNIPPDALQKIDVPAVDFYRVYNIAWELARKGQYAASVIEWRHALELSPNEPNVYMNLGVALARMGKMDEAVAQYQKALDLSPDSTEILLRLGKALADAGKFDEAAARYRKVLEIAPAGEGATDLATANNLIGETLVQRGQLAEALQYFDKAAALLPAFAANLYDRALVLVRLNRFDEAQESVEAALRADAGMALAHSLRGGLLARRRQFPDAAREYERTLELLPEFGQAHLDLASVLAAQGDMAAAVAHLRLASKANDPSVAQAATRALQRLGQQ